MDKKTVFFVDYNRRLPYADFEILGCRISKSFKLGSYGVNYAYKVRKGELNREQYDALMKKFKGYIGYCGIMLHEATLEKELIKFLADCKVDVYIEKNYDLSDSHYRSFFALVDDQEINKSFEFKRMDKDGKVSDILPSKKDNTQDNTQDNATAPDEIFLKDWVLVEHVYVNPTISS